MGLKDIGATLPPGFRFNPSDEELICHYLFKKISNEEVLEGTLMEVDLHTCEPWQLPEMAKLNASEWYFFSFRDRKYATGFRTNRATTSGYWKATGKDRTVHGPVTTEVAGMRKTLVFYLNRAPHGTKTGWIMHEFRLETSLSPPEEDWVLCRVFYKGKQGEDTSNPIRHTFQNNLKPATTYSSPPKNPTSNNTFHKHNIIHQPHITMMSLNPNSIFHHFGHKPNNPAATATQISISALAHTHNADNEEEEDYDCLRFLWGFKEDDNNGMDIVSILEDQMLLELDDVSMVL